MSTNTRFFDDFTDEFNDVTKSFASRSFTLNVKSKTPHGLAISSTAKTPSWKDLAKHNKDERKRQPLKPLSATVKPSCSWEEFGTRFAVSLTHDKIEVSGEKETLFGVDGTEFAVTAESDLTADWKGSKVEAEAKFANEKVAVRAQANYEYDAGFQGGNISIAGQYKSFHLGVRPSWEASGEENEPGDKAMDFAVLYHQPDYQVQVGGAFSAPKLVVGVDWYQKVSDAVAYTLSLTTKRNNESGDYAVTTGNVAGKWKLDDSTQLAGRVSVSRKKDKRAEMRADLSLTQQIAPFCQATLYADVNVLKVTSGNAAPGKPHAFAVELSLE